MIFAIRKYNRRSCESPPSSACISPRIHNFLHTTISVSVEMILNSPACLARSKQSWTALHNGSLVSTQKILPSVRSQTWSLLSGVFRPSHQVNAVACVELHCSHQHTCRWLRNGQLNTCCPYHGGLKSLFLGSTSMNDTRDALYACPFDLTARNQSPWCDAFYRVSLFS